MLDTDVISALSKPRPPRNVVQWLKEHADECGISIITMGEIIFGISRCPDDVTHHKLSGWLASLREQFADAILPVTEDSILEWKQLLAELKARNRTIPAEDSLIAALARQHSLVVVTFKSRHFTEAGVNVIDLEKSPQN